MQMQIELEMEIESYILTTLPTLGQRAVGKRKRYFCSLKFDTDKHDVTLWPLSSWLLNYLLNRLRSFVLPRANVIPSLDTTERLKGKGKGQEIHRAGEGEKWISTPKERVKRIRKGMREDVEEKMAEETQEIREDWVMSSCHTPHFF